MKLIAILMLAGLVTLGATSCSKQAESCCEITSGKQTTCPVMKGSKIDPKLYVDVNGKRIYVCCPGCIAPIKADPGKYIAQMEAEGIVLEDAPAAGQE